MNMDLQSGPSSELEGTSTSTSDTAAAPDAAAAAAAAAAAPPSQSEDVDKITPPPPNPLPPPRLPTLRTTAEIPQTTMMTTSSTPLGNLNAARRPPLSQSAGGTPSSRGSQLPQDMQAKMKAFHLSRQGAPSQNSRMSPVVGPRSNSGPSSSTATGPSPGGPLSAGVSGTPDLASPGGPLVGVPGGFRLNSPITRPQPPNLNSAPAVPSLNPKMGLAAKRGLKGGLKLSDATGPPPASPPNTTQDQKGDDTKEKSATEANSAERGGGESLFNKYSEYVDTKTGTLKFKGKATIHGKGIDFSSGTSFNISLDEVDTLDELGKGNYGTVYKVRHSRPQLRRPGQGLGGNKALPSTIAANGLADCPSKNASELSTPRSAAPGNTTGVVMAMKEIRLELDEAKFAAIIMELDILHRCSSPYIIDFYGAFFQEGAVYICMEYMDGGSIDKLYGDGVPESVLRKITYANVVGLKSLKDEHNIIHRDVKPTNILVNTRGHVKICDFGVSGNLVASIAKTNIGCQSYMAPERISGGGVAQAGANPGGGTYSVQSDIWSLGLTIIECALGQYPYPPETYDNIFSQLSAIVDGDPPDLPTATFSDEAHNFVHGALNKIPKLRPTYAMLLRHPWLAPLAKPATITEEDEEAPSPDQTTKDEEDLAPGVHDPEVAQWVVDALERKALGKMGQKAKPALHAAPLDAAVPSPH